jgi:hypothetical protein
LITESASRDATHVPTGRAVISPKLRVDRVHSLDLAELNRIGFLERSHGTTGRSTWRWPWNPEFESSVTLALAVDGTGPQGVVLRHHDPNTGRWSTYPVRFTWTPCPFGGGRLWFVCPGRGGEVACNRRCRVLYRPSAAQFACRICWNLTYESRQRHRDRWYEGFEIPVRVMERAESRT